MTDHRNYGEDVYQPSKMPDVILREQSARAASQARVACQSRILSAEAETAELRRERADLYDRLHAAESALADMTEKYDDPMQSPLNKQLSALELSINDLAQRCNNDMARSCAHGGYMRAAWLLRRRRNFNRRG
jgi:hypothetical protein